MRTANGFQNATQEQITWELDGGNYHANDQATLFEGRLYICPYELAVARVKSKTKFVGRVLAALIPLLVFMNNRN